MHSIGSAHAEVRSRRREISLVSTTDRILFIIDTLTLIVLGTRRWGQGEP